MVASKKPSKGTTPKKAAAKKPPRAQKPVLEKAREIVQKTAERLNKPVVTVTDARQAPAPFPVVIEELQNPPINTWTFEEVKARAWDAIKDAADPIYQDCAPDFKATLDAHARSALRRNGTLLSGDAPLARFEQAVNRLRQFYKGEI